MQKHLREKQQLNPAQNCEPHLSVRDHHRHSPELHLQILRKLLTTCVARVLKIKHNSLRWII